MQPQYESPGVICHKITPRERQALQLLADGDTPRQVSIGLAISAAETEALLDRLLQRWAPRLATRSARSRERVSCKR